MGTTRGLKHLEISTMKLQLFVLSVILLSGLKGTEGCVNPFEGLFERRSIEEIKVPADRTEWDAAIEDLVDRIDRGVPELGVKQWNIKQWNGAIEDLVDRIDRAVPELGIKHFYNIAKNGSDV